MAHLTLRSQSRPQMDHDKKQWILIPKLVSIHPHMLYGHTSRWYAVLPNMLRLL
jgi:hypothetical protein